MTVSISNTLILISLVSFASGANKCAVPLSDEPIAKAIVAALIKDLKEKDAATRARAAERLGDLGQGAIDSVPALIEALRDKDEKVVVNASIALAQFGERAVPFLVGALDREEKEVSTHLLNALNHIGPKAKTAAPAMIKLMKENSSDKTLRILAMGVLAQINDKDTVPAIIDVVTRDGDAAIRQAAIGTLSNFGPKAKAAIPILIAVMKTELSKSGPPELESAILGSSAASTLGFIGSDAVAPLVDLLKDATLSSNLRSTAGWSLERIAQYHGGAAIKLAIPSLIESLQDENDGLAAQAAGTFAEMEKHAKAAIPALKDALKNKCATVRIKAADALCRIEPTNSVAMPVLTGELLGKDEKASDLARSNLTSLDKRAVPGLILELKNGNVSARAGAIAALKLLGPSAKEATPALREALKDPDSTIRESARELMKSIQRD